MQYNITIPRLEVISTHMGANLVQNVKSALDSENVRSGWTNSTLQIPDSRYEKKILKLST